MLYKYINETTIKEETNPLIEDDYTITNPTEQILRNYGYKDVVAGRVVEEVSTGKYIVTTYEDGESITKNEDLADKEVIDEPKPEEPLDEYFMWVTYTYETATQIIHTWRAEAKPIEGEEPECNKQTQYLTWEDEVLEEKVIRTYTVNEKTVETKEIPVHPEPVEYEAHPEYWELVEHVDYSQPTTITKSYTWKTTEERRIAYLTSTKRDFCLAIKELKGITYSQLMQLVESSESFLMEWRECTVLYRFNSSLDLAGQAFGLTHEDINNIFRYINGEINLEELKAE